MNHPSGHFSRETTTEYERQNTNVFQDYRDDIDAYLRRREIGMFSADPLANHAISGTVRARMIDWKIEVTMNFKCDDHTFFLSVSYMDQFFAKCQALLHTDDLHIIGVTCMFMASKYECI